MPQSVELASLHVVPTRYVLIKGDWCGMHTVRYVHTYNTICRYDIFQFVDMILGIQP
jgi:hypothetical protein